MSKIKIFLQYKKIFIDSLVMIAYYINKYNQEYNMRINKMKNNTKINNEDMQKYLLCQIDVIKKCAEAYGLKFLRSYLDLAEEIIAEELQQKID